MSKGFDMLRDYIEHDALCMRRRKCCDFEYELQQEFEEMKQLICDMQTCIEHIDDVTGAFYDCTGCPLDDTEACDFEGRMAALGIKAGT